MSISARIRTFSWPSSESTWSRSGSLPGRPSQSSMARRSRLNRLAEEGSTVSRAHMPI
jgi:hypothetical protein